MSVLLPILDWLVTKIGIPLLMEYMKRADEDPEFRIRAEVVFAEWAASSTTAERRKALKDMHALLKG